VALDLKMRLPYARPARTGDGSRYLGSLNPDRRHDTRAVAPQKSPTLPLTIRIFAPFLILPLLSAGCSPARTVEAAYLLQDVAQVDAPASVSPYPAAPGSRVAVTYAATGTAPSRRAHLYLPNGARAALVLVPGAAEAALDDPRLVAFAEALTRRGFLVLVPALADDDAPRVSAADADAVADALHYLTGEHAFPTAGLAALSYAVGPALVAALEDDLHDRVGFIVAIGGYHDIAAAITFATTGAFREGPGAPWRTAPTDARAKWRFLAANAGRVGDPSDARTLAEIARARIADPAVDTGALAARLGAEGRAVHALLVNRDPDRVPALVADLPSGLRDEIAALDLSRRDLTRLGAPLILIHGRSDPLVPYTESLALARAAGPAGARLYLLDDLDHVDLGAPGLGDLATLLHATYRILAERDAAPRPAGPVLLRIGAHPSL
jgi:pimeloyl-ACP methyl ester carboxylesterase